MSCFICLVIYVYCVYMFAAASEARLLAHLLQRLRAHELLVRRLMYVCVYIYMSYKH